MVVLIVFVGLAWLSWNGGVCKNICVGIRVSSEVDGAVLDKSCCATCLLMLRRLSRIKLILLIFIG